MDLTLAKKENSKRIVNLTRSAYSATTFLAWLESPIKYVSLNEV